MPCCLSRKKPASKEEAVAEPVEAPAEPDLDWDGITSMQPSAALQARLKGLKRTMPSVITAFDPTEAVAAPPVEKDPAQSSPAPETMANPAAGAFIAFPSGNYKGVSCRTHNPFSRNSCAPGVHCNAF